MKEMKADELTKEYCRAKEKGATYLADSKSAFEYSIKLLGVSSGGHAKASEKFRRLSDSFEQCKSQTIRIERVMASKGVDEVGLKELCADRELIK